MDRETPIGKGLVKILEGIAIVRREHQVILDDGSYRQSYLLRLNSLVNGLNSLELEIRDMP